MLTAHNIQEVLHMADDIADDVYNDPDNILADTDDSVDGATELPEAENDSISQSIFVPERANDDRGTIDELEESDGTSKRDEANGAYPEDEDSDSDRLGDMNPADERDGSEP